MSHIPGIVATTSATGTGGGHGVPGCGTVVLFLGIFIFIILVAFRSCGNNYLGNELQNCLNCLDNPPIDYVMIDSFI